MPSEDVVLLHKIEEQGDNGNASIVFFLNGAHANNTVDDEPPRPTLLNEAARTARGPLDEPVKALATLTGYWGKQITFKDIVAAGALVKKSDGDYGQAGGFTMGMLIISSHILWPHSKYHFIGWDNCSNTPVCFNLTSSLFGADSAILFSTSSTRLRRLLLPTTVWTLLSHPAYPYHAFSFTDTWSLTDKATYAKSSGMAGCFTWSLDQVSLVALFLLLTC
jgi:chitinase